MCRSAWSELLNAIGNSQVIFLIGSIVLLIVIGTLLEGLPALNVLAPLLLPIAGAIGLSQLHYGIMLVIAMGIGAFMPLAGVGFYVCCAVMRSPVEDVARHAALSRGADGGVADRRLHPVVHAVPAAGVRLRGVKPTL